MDTFTRDNLTFRVRRSTIPRIEALAARYGIEVEVSEIDHIVLALTLYEIQSGHIPRSYLDIPEAFKAWAKRLCAEHVEIIAHAPVSEWSVIALASKEEGAAMYHTIDPVSEYWTTETMDSIDWSRCDECGVKHARSRVFIIRKGDETRQIGGSCTKHLDLTKKLRDLVKGFQSFLKALGEDDGWDFMEARHRGNTLNLALAMLLTEEMISFEGYVSKKGAEACMRMSTADSVMQMLGDDEKTTGGKYRNNDQWRNAHKRWLAGEGEAILTECLTWLDDQPDDPFHRNIRTALKTESRKYIGLIAFAVAEIRNWRLALEAKKNGIQPKCYDHVADMPVADVAAACGLTVDGLAGLLGIEPAKMAKAPGKKACAKVLPGAWTLIARASWESAFGWQDMVQFQREDGSRVKWMTGSLDADVTWLKGDKYLILSASLGDDLGNHAQYGVQGRKISRAFIRPVDPKNLKQPYVSRVDKALQEAYNAGTL